MGHTIEDTVMRLLWYLVVVRRYCECHSFREVVLEAVVL